MSNLLQALEEEVRYCEERLKPEVPTAEIFENRTDRLRLYLLYIKTRIKSLKEGEEFSVLSDILIFFVKKTYFTSIITTCSYLNSFK